MKNIINKIALSSLALLLSAAASAQHKHEFSLWGEGGLSTLKYKSTFGKQKNGFGGAVGLGYTYFFSENWGVGTGAEFSLYNAKTNLGDLTENYWIVDRDEKDADYHFQLKKYTEKQSLTTVNVPLFVQYQGNGVHKFYASLGGKVAFPVKGKYKSSNSEIKTWAYYPYVDQTLYDPREEGYGEFSGTKIKGDVDYKIAYVGSAEAGMKWRLNEGWSLYTGLYFDYGFNNIKKKVKNDKKFIEYNHMKPGDLIVNSMMESQYVSNGNTKVFTDKINLMAAGVKVKLAFGVGSFNKKVKEVPPRMQTRPAEPLVPIINEAAEAEARRRAEEEARLRAVADARLKAEEEARRKAEEAKKAEYNKAKEDIAFTLDHFQLGKSVLIPSIIEILDSKVAILKAHPEMKITVSGHTCNIDTPQKNQEVGMRRADEVKDYMIKKGISASRIVTVSKGETQPVAPNTNNANRLKNRRVEVVAHE